MGSGFRKKRPPNKTRSKWEKARRQDGYRFIRKGTGLTRNLVNGSLRLENLTHGTNSKALEAAVLTAEPGFCCDETEIYLGEKWYYILEGKLEILVNDNSYLLSEGDSIYLESTAVHTWRNSHDGKTKALMFSSPRSFSI